MTTALEKIYLKIDTLETCFYCLEDLINGYTAEKTLTEQNKLENFFYLLWDQLKEARTEIGEAARTAAKERCETIRKLEAENEALRKKLSEFPHA